MSFPIHARYAHPEAGWEDDRKKAAAALTVGEIYTIHQMTVGSSTSYLTFHEVDGKFNTVLFDAADWPGDQDTEGVPE